MVKVHILGTAQDSGFPQVGCDCPNCKIALNDVTKRRLVASIAIIGKESILLIDATPDFKEQITILNKTYPKESLYRYKMGADAILITHIHIGHYSGLINLGKEVCSTTNYPVYTTEDNQIFFEQNKPYSYLTKRKEVDFKTIKPDETYEIDPEFSLDVIDIPHRNEDGNTIGIKVTSMESNRTLLYIPDIDFISDQCAQHIHNSDIVLFDGTFFTSTEHPHQAKIPHPPIVETIKLIGKRDPGSFYFTHFNHTNPILQKEKEYQTILTDGYLVAEDNQIINL